MTLKIINFEHGSKCEMYSCERNSGKTENGFDQRN